MTCFKFHNFTSLNIKKWDNSENTLMTQKSIFQLNQKHCNIVRNKTP